MVCHQRFKLFVRPVVIECFLFELETWRAENDIDMFGWVVMPEHAHLVLRPRHALLLGTALGKLKSKSARAMLPLLNQDAVDQFLTVNRNNETRRVFWTRRVYDHNCRSPEAVRQKIEYCHKNPVRRGLVNNMNDWPWSSFRTYEEGSTQIVKVSEFEV